MVLKKYILAATLNVAWLGSAFAQIGQPWIHDPSTLVECDGKWYTFGTGGGGIVTDDGWSWHSGPVRPGGGAAPDAMKIGDRYLIAYSATGGGLGGGHNGRVLTMWNETLDPQSPRFKFTEPIEVASSDGDEDCDAIDAGLLLDPTTGRLWLSYGTYFGNIRIVELDPKTGARKDGNKAKDIAIDCEASDLIYKDGYYYLLGTHGTCCDGVNSTYNIVCGRSKEPTGPYIDNVGRDMFHGGGRMVVAGGKRAVGAGHFGRTVIDEGVEVTSFHWEADLDRSGRSVLAIRPLLWKNGWPYAGEKLEEGTYSIISERRGYSLEISVDFVRMEQERAMWHRVAITAVPEAGGYLSNPYFKITIEGTERALCATADMEVETVAKFTGDDSQLWRIEQLTDGTYRIMPKKIPGKEGVNKEYVLYSIADSTPILEKYDFNSDNSKWNLKK